MSRDQLNQKYHADSDSNPNLCDGIGRLSKIEVRRDTIFNQPWDIAVTWHCCKCHDTFMTYMTYLEILPMGPGEPLG